MNNYDAVTTMLKALDESDTVEKDANLLSAANVYAKLALVDELAKTNAQLRGINDGIKSISNYVRKGTVI